MIEIVGLRAWLDEENGQVVLEWTAAAEDPLGFSTITAEIAVPLVTVERP